MEFGVLLVKRDLKEHLCLRLNLTTQTVFFATIFSKIIFKWKYSLN